MSEKRNGNAKLAYTIREAGDIISVSRSTFYNLMRKGDIRTIKVGRRVIIAHSELERFIGHKRKNRGAP